MLSLLPIAHHRAELAEVELVVIVQVGCIAIRSVLTHARLKVLLACTGRVTRQHSLHCGIVSRMSLRRSCVSTRAALGVVVRFLLIIIELVVAVLHLLLWPSLNRGFLVRLIHWLSV